VIKLSKKFILSIPLALVSLQIFFGIVIGYIIGKFLSGKKVGQSGIIKSIILQIGRYRLHLHHWLFSLSVLLLSLMVDFLLPLPKFSLSLLGGLTIQGIICYPDWHRILVKQF
jgi:hypothetical protein